MIEVLKMLFHLQHVFIIEFFLIPTFQPVIFILVKYIFLEEIYYQNQFNSTTFLLTFKHQSFILHLHH